MDFWMILDIYDHSGHGLSAGERTIVYVCYDYVPKSVPVYLFNL